MSYLGEFFQGEWVNIPVVCRNASLAEANATAAPVLNIYRADNTPITGADDITMAPFAQGERTGYFNRAVQLDSNFTAGRYVCHIAYAVSGSNKAELHFFQVVAGGNAKGAYVALWYYPRPHAKYIVGQLDDGTLEMRRGPKI
jgi:hypothetical protein